MPHPTIENEEMIRESNLAQERVINERKCRPTQLERLRNLFERREGMWIPLPEILKTGCAQYNVRLMELRNDKHHPMNIVNRIEVIDGVKHSFYRYTQDTKTGQQRMF
jgi:hypothetical protein